MPPRPPSRPGPAAPSLLNQAVAAHQAGRLDEAEALYARVLEQQPGQFDATHLRGVIALQRGHLETAQALIARALEGKPKDAAALNNLGTAFLRAGRLDDAREQFERAAKAQPAYADAQANLGNVLRQLGRVADAVAPLRRAHAANPKSAATADLLGASLLETGDTRAALAIFEAAAKARPREVEVWTNLAIAALEEHGAKRALEAADAALKLAPPTARMLSLRGRALAGLGELAGAREAFAQALRTSPEDAEAQHNFGVFLREQGEFDAAAARLREALRLAPTLATARQALVDTLIDAGRGDEAAAHGDAWAAEAQAPAAALAAQAAARFAQDRVDEAVALYARAVAAPGAAASAFEGYGNALMAVGDAPAATRQFQRAVELDPGAARPRFALAMSHLRLVYDDVAQMEASRRTFARAIGELDAWCTPARATGASVAVGSTQPFYLAYHPVDPKPLLAPYGRIVARLGAAVPVAKATAQAPLAPLRARKLRVAIAAAHIRDHSVWNAITRGWVDHLDRSRFDLSLFQLERTSDAETAHARTRADRFVDAPANLAAWAQAIADAEPDVLIYPEIGMHPLTTRLAAMRLAPVQAVAWGHPQTSGLPTMDLYLSAQAFEPPQGASHYVERLVALPGIGVSLRALKPASVAPDLVSLGLPSTEPLLLCPGTPFKYTPASDPAWVEIARGLQARGRGRLVFFRSHRASLTDALEQRLRRACAAAGVDAARTIAWIPTLPRERFFGLMQRAALMLDTIGFSGFNTALQALECDLPVVAFEGEFMRGRLASGPLRAIGLDELVATDIPAFAALALRLVDDDAARLRLKGEIATRRARLFDDVATVQALEETLAEAAGKA